MTGWLALFAAWLSAVANAMGRILLAPVGSLPGWLSATLVAAATGILLLVVFKYTSNQRAIKRVRDDISADLLALKLFKDSARVSLQAQARILRCALRLAVLAIVPIVIMTLPVTLLLAQLGLWYQARPLHISEEAVITLKAGGDAASPLPAVALRPTEAVAVEVGPVRVPSKREVCWNVSARRAGSHVLVFQVADRTYTKELAVGEGFARVSPERPGWDALSILLNPWETPFRPDDAVRSIEIKYPPRNAWTCGSDKWVFYWFGASLVAAFCFRPLVKVNV
jgi:hypothetical protein